MPLPSSSPADAVRATLAAFPATGRRLLVTAGPTVEDIDAVRFLTNRSTGRMGLAVAEAAATAAWSTLLILGPTPLPLPYAWRDDATSPHRALVRVRSAADMTEAVAAALGSVDALVMTAAVADYTPATPIPGKLKKSEGDWTLTLKRTVDILSMVKEHPTRAGEAAQGALTRRLRAVVGFSLGVDMDEAEGWRKLRAKGLDGIVVNTASAFGASTTTARFLRVDGTTRDFGAASKETLASALLDELDAFMRHPGETPKADDGANV